MGSFAEVFRGEAGAKGILPFDRFMELALYHPECGYYSAASRRRVGRSEGTDFYTASSVPLFGELIAAAAAELLGPRNPKDYTWIEIGAERGAGVLDGLAHPFKAARSLGLGEPIDLDGACIVFSNELFDAQPFRRFVRREGGWRELGVRQAECGWEEEEFDPACEPDRGRDAHPGPDVDRGADLDHGPLRGTSREGERRAATGRGLPCDLPAEAEEGYRIDAPTGAFELARRIAAQPWTGLFLAADYGKSWDELAHGTPTGTARAYRQHRQSNDLLADPGEQDLTCHVCWDWLQGALQRAAFRDVRREAQETFLVRHAGGRLAELTARSASGADPAKRAIMQLLHPSLMGRKFQVLHALRPSP